MMLSFATGLNGVFAAAVLAIGLAGAAPAATLERDVLPAGPSADPVAFATGGTVLGNDAAEFAYIRAAGIPQAPIPATGLMVLTALGGRAMLRRRKAA